MAYKKEGILRLIILYKAVWGVSEVLISLFFYRLVATNSDEPFRALALAMRFDPDNGLASYFVEHADSIETSLLFAFAALIFVLGFTNAIEAWGLHRRQRWAEWLTVIANSLLIPYELYHVVTSFGFLQLSILVINVLIVYYLAKHKELFKSRKEGRSAGEKIT
ncbi:MAG: DUF2127 domain-containing protein [Thermodesulfobacteriota bacterium]|nr:MAG: DUF2127 domain-containing protein [Thermodesulfobacteriota bacterium]